jgi:putative membrane protein insertion efficiency factor
MKKLLLAIIIIYQHFLSPLFKQLLGTPSFCRYQVTCSEYAKRAISKYGVVKGISLGVKRILHCQPFTHTYEYI